MSCRQLVAGGELPSGSCGVPEHAGPCLEHLLSDSCGLSLKGSAPIRVFGCVVIWRHTSFLLTLCVTTTNLLTLLEMGG